MKGHSSDSFLMVHHGIIQATNSLTTSAVLAVLREHRTKLMYLGTMPDDGFFYMPQTKLAQRLCLKRVDTIKHHTDILEEIGLLETKHAGMPRRLYYRLLDVEFEKLARRGLSYLAGTDADMGGDGDPQPPAEPDTSIRANRGTYKKKSKKESVSSNHQGRKRPQRIALGGNPHQHDIDAAKAKAQTKVPKSFEPALDKWATVAKRHAQGTKALREGVAALRAVQAGTFFRGVPGCEQYVEPYTMKDILRAMDTFAAKRNDPTYLPHDKTFLKRLSLSQFFFTPYGHSNGGPPSVFLECLLHPPKPVGDTHPHLHAVIQARFKHHQHDDITPKEAARAAARLGRYWKDNTKKLKGLGVISDTQLVTKWCGWLATTRSSFGVHHIGMRDLELGFEKHLRQNQT